jgi:hypothetical protein
MYIYIYIFVHPWYIYIVKKHKKMRTEYECLIFRSISLPVIMNQMQTNANTDLAKDYLSKRKIPELFEVKSILVSIKINYINNILGFNDWSYGS